MRLRKQVVLDVMKKEISEVVQTEYETFVENTCDCDRASMIYNFEDWFYEWNNLEAIFKKIYETGKVNYYGFEGKTFKDLYKYENFKGLFYEDFLEVVKKEINKIVKLLDFF